MNQQQLRTLTRPLDLTAGALISQMTDRSDRTLVWGYTTDRESFHVYLKDGVLIRIVYKDEKNLDTWSVLRDPDALQSVPNKRIYPEACDFEFCSILDQMGIYLPFTTFDESRPSAQFHGAVAPVEKFLV